MKQIFCKYKCKCAETGRKISKGDTMVYDYSSRKCYSVGSETYKVFQEREDQRRESNAVSSYVRAQEEAFFENQWHACR